MDKEPSLSGRKKRQKFLRGQSLTFPGNWGLGTLSQRKDYSEKRGLICLKAELGLIFRGRGTEAYPGGSPPKRKGEFPSNQRN